MCFAGGLVEPPVVPRFLDALEEGGAAARRVDAYVTRAGVTADDIAPEAALMSGGCVDAVIFTSTAEAQGLLAALGGAEDLQALVLEQGVHLPSSRQITYPPPSHLLVSSHTLNCTSHGA